MAISNSATRISYTGNGVQTAFPFPYVYYNQTQLLVYVDGVVQSLGGAYTVSPTTSNPEDGNPIGGTVTFLSAPANGTVVQIIRSLLLEQTVVLNDGGNFPAKTIEKNFDQLVMMLQQHEEELTRTLHTPVSESTDMTLPSASARANKFLAFDATGVPFASPGASLVPVSAFMATVLDDATALDARTTLDVEHTTVTPTGGTASRQLPDHFADSLSINDFSGTFTEKLQAAVASGAKAVFVPFGSYTQTAKITLPDNFSIWSNCFPTITKGFNGDLFDMSADFCKLIGLNILGDGGTFTGRGVVISGGQEQRIESCQLDDFDGYAAEFTADDAGQRCTFWNTHFRRTTVLNPAVKLPTLGVSETNGNRNFINCTSNGGCLIDFADGTNTRVWACAFTQLSFSTNNASRTIINANRIAALGGTITIKGFDNVISGNVVAGDIVLDTGTQRNHVGVNDLLDGATVTDSSTATGNDVNHVWDVTEKSVTPNWKGDTSDPAIGNGSIAASVVRNGRAFQVNISVGMGSTTTFGSGDWYFTLPSPYDFKARDNSVGSAYILDNGTAFFIGVARMSSGSNQIRVYVNNAATGIRSTVPMTWATNDNLNISIEFEATR